jgi:hypothetical protein
LEVSERKFLWTVTDPRGLSITLAEDVWLSHVVYRPELTEHFEWFRVAVADPDAIYFDADSTARKTPGTQVFWYYRTAPLPGKFKGNYVVVIVKIVLDAQGQRGFVESAMLPSRILNRLVLVWKR